MAEIAIKASLGKLSAPRDLFVGLEDEGFTTLTVSFIMPPNSGTCLGITGIPSTRCGLPRRGSKA
jgi:hypothetical protein